MSSVLAISCVLCLTPTLPQDRERGHHPLDKDRTGMEWVLPFTAAKAKAAKEKRLLLIKPVAFGTSRDGGW